MYSIRQDRKPPNANYENPGINRLSKQSSIRSSIALNPNAREAADRFPAQVQEVLGWLGDGLPEGHPFRSVAASPAPKTSPRSPSRARLRPAKLCRCW